MDKQQKMSHKLAGYSAANTAENDHSMQVLSEFAVDINPSVQPPGAFTFTKGTSPSGFMAGAVNGLLSGTTFNNCPVNIFHQFPV